MSRFVGFLAALTIGVACQLAAAQFTTIHNLPPDPDLGDGVQIGWRTQINLGEGGRIGDDFRLGVTSYNVDVELNMSGGSIGDGTTFDRDSVTRVTGGVIGDDFLAQRDSFLTLVGDDFRVEGVPVQGLEALGDSVVMAQRGVTFTGILADGSAFAFALGRTDGASGSAQITFEKAEVASVATGEVVVANSVAPQVAQSGQSIRVAAGGTVAKNFMAAPNSSVLVEAGGSIGRNFEAIDADVRITGGVIGDSLELFQGAGLVIEGGSIGDGVYSRSGGPVAIYGEAFRIGGVEVAGLSQPGDSVQVAAVNELTGVLGDGTPIAFSPSDGDSLFSEGVTFHYRPAPAPVPGVILASGGPVPGSVRGSQELVVDAGSSVGPHFVAGVGSTVTVQPGGLVGRNLEAIEARVDVRGGTVGPAMDAFQGSSVTVESGGEIGDDFYASGSQVELMDGSLGEGATISDGSVIRVEGGTVGEGLRVQSGSRLHVTGGTIRGGVSVTTSDLVEITGGVFTVEGSFLHDARFDRVANTSVSGGRVEGDLRVTDGPLTLSGGRVDGNLKIESRLGVIGSFPTSLRLVGDDFRVNGEAVAGLDTVGASAVSTGGANNISGTLADGTPFSFSPWDNDNLALAEGLTFERAPVAAVGQANLDASQDALGAGIRKGQSLVVPAGAAVEPNYNAGLGSRVIVESEGTVGENFEAAGAVVEVRGGTIEAEADFVNGARLDLHSGTLGQGTDVVYSTVNLFGGNVEGSSSEIGATAYEGAEINLLGTAEATRLQARNGGTVNIRGGLVAGASAIRGGFLNITGGEVVGGPGSSANAIVTSDTSVVTISGGVISDRIVIGSAGELHLYGSEFALDGDSLVLAPGESRTISERGGSTLQAVLADGELLDLTLFTGTTVPGNDAISASAALVITHYTIGDFNGDGAVDLSDHLAWESGYGLIVPIAGQGADGNFDGVVNAADYIVWRDAYDAAVAGAAVPEPGAAVFALVALVAASGCRRRVF